MEDSKVNKRLRDESEEADSDIDSPEVKRLRDNLFDVSDEESEIFTTGSDLDSFMRSFEKEITAGGGAVAEVVDLTSDSCESRPELGYLLEATDDDLELPPNSAADLSEFGADLWGFEAGIPGNDPRGFGLIQTEVLDGGNGEYAVIDGLFNYSDMGFGSGDFFVDTQNFNDPIRRIGPII